MSREFFKILLFFLITVCHKQKIDILKFGQFQTVSRDFIQNLTAFTFKNTLIRIRRYIEN